MNSKATTSAKTAASKAVATKVPAKKTAAVKLAATKTPATKTPVKTTPAVKVPVAAAPDAVKAVLQAPGAFLAARIVETGLTESGLARAIDVAPRRIRQIIEGERRMTADTAVRLGAFFGDDAMMWLGLQAASEVEAARGELSKTLAAIVPLARAAQKPVVVQEAA